MCKYADVQMCKIGIVRLGVMGRGVMKADGIMPTGKWNAQCYFLFVTVQRFRRLYRA
jgi:hypothetical protein